VFVAAGVISPGSGFRARVLMTARDISFWVILNPLYPIRLTGKATQQRPR
jgi:hypothetical protein